MAFARGRTEWANAALLFHDIRTNPLDDVEECTARAPKVGAIELGELGVDGVIKATLYWRDQADGAKAGRDGAVLGITTPEARYEYIATSRHAPVRRTDPTNRLPYPDTGQDAAVGLDEAMAAISVVWDGINTRHMYEELGYARFQQAVYGGRFIPNFQVVEPAAGHQLAQVRFAPPMIIDF